MGIRGPGSFGAPALSLLLFTEPPRAKVSSESPLTHESIKLVWLQETE
jgi:hypothetical protein